MEISSYFLKRENQIYIAIILLNMYLSYMTFVIGKATYSNVPRSENPYDMFYSIIPDFSKNRILNIVITVLNLLPVLLQFTGFLPSELSLEYSKYGIILLILGNIISLITMYNPPKTEDCAKEYTWFEMFVWHCYKSFFNDAFANACILSVLMLKYKFSYVVSLSYPIILFVLSIMKRFKTIDLIMSGMIGMGLMSLDINGLLNM